MKKEKTIKLYVYVDGVNDVPFYGSDAGEYEAFILANGEQYTTSEGFVFNVRNVNEQIEIGYFRYDAKRMGGAPTITCTLMYEDCLDDFWSENVYAEFNGEKYYLKQTPTSSYSNESTMYKHDLELVSERVILDNVYFFDAVVGEPQGDDKPVSNGTKVVFFGNIHEFVKRLNSSLEYAKLLKWEDGVDDNGNAIKIPKGYHVVVDDDNNITKEERLMSFEDQFFSNVLQEIYNTYEVPYYFEGKTIHIGFSNSNAVVPTFSYGVDDALLSITKNNANYKIVNRATATGSSDNIPFYYPNNSPKGNIKAEVNTSSSNFSVNIVDYEKYSNEVAIGETFTFLKNNVAIKGTSTSKVSFTTSGTPKTKNYRFDMAKIVAEFEIDASFQTTQVLRFIPTNTLQCIASGEHYMNNEPHSESELFNNVFNAGVARITGTVSNQVSVNRLDKIEFEVFLYQGVNKLKLEIEYKAGYQNFLPVGKINSLHIGGDCTWTIEGSGEYSCWRFKDNCVKIEDYGLSYNGIPANGDTITQRLVKYVKTSQNLMPSIYRETDSDERFYNAKNYPYPKPEGFDNTLLNGYYGEDGILRNPLGEYEVEGYIHNDAYKNEDGTYIHFNNPYVEGRPKEHIFTVEDIKPTIKDTMVGGLRIDMFSEFAYDDDDNDETYEDEEGNVYFKHPYFYGKLRVMDFNLFDHAIENQPMTISFTSGHCGACNFEIGVTEEYPQKNPVQVYEADTLIDGVLHKKGSLKRDENGMVLAGVEGTQQDVTTFQERQQDTSKYAVWIALKKEEETYGILMPQAAHRPKAAGRGNKGDTFVILGINLPQSYIINAEKKLDAEIIKYLQDNNDEKFTFSIEFSRIYFEENDILNQLSENSKIAIMYNGQRYDLYVSSFSYSMSEGDVLPEIRVELDETLKVSQNALQNAISQVKSELGRAIGSIDVVGVATPYFLRKDADDEAQGRINFKKGIKFGEGGKVEILDNNSAKLTIEYLEVTKKASFTSLEIQEKTHVGGQMLITPAAINCGEVEEFDDYYRCYFQTKGEDGDEIFNQFEVGDQAICQTFNAWGSKFYWRLVVGIGEDYIDLSKTDCDEYSDIPSAGDKIIQMGNRNDQARQNAIVIAAYGDDSPSLIMYNGINSYSLVGKNITGIIWNPETKEPQMYSYGSFFFGDRQLSKNFITFQKKEGDTDKNLYINGKVTIGAGSEGLSNLSEWSEKQTQINNAQETANNAISQAGAAKDDIAKELGYADYNDMKEQALANGSLIMPNGYLNAGLIEAGAIVSNMIAANAITAEKIDTDNLVVKQIYAAEGKTIVGSDGVLKSKGGEFETVKINGTSRSLFQQDDGTPPITSIKPVEINTSDNIALAANGQASLNTSVLRGSDASFSFDNNIDFDWDESQIGRRRVIVNYMAYGMFTSSVATYKASSGKYFFDDGQRKTELVVYINECIELLGYGYENTFLGWIVISRTDMASGYSSWNRNGMAAGLRPMARGLSGTVTLTPYDHTIFASNASTKLYLPSNPEDGQEYVILAPNGGVTIHGNGKQIYLFHDGINRSSYTCGDLGTRTEQRLYWNKADNKWWATYIKF